MSGENPFESSGLHERVQVAHKVIHISAAKTVMQVGHRFIVSIIESTRAIGE